ncbi:hypothetical protein IWQ49_004756 [Labrenzia sp. EL_126]|nr:hypothetical protein [Labrenzia sp. EL_126]
MRASHHGLAATAVHSREAEYIYANWCRRHSKSLQRQGGPYISTNNVLKHLAVQCQVRHDLLEPVILVFQFSQELHLRRQQTRLFLFPVEIRRLADPSFPAQIRDRLAVFTLLDDERFLRVREAQCFHQFRPFPAKETVAKNSNHEWQENRASEQSRCSTT